MPGNIIPLDYKEYSTMKFEKVPTLDDIRLVVKDELHRNKKDNISMIDCCITCAYTVIVVSLLVVIYLTVTKMNGHIDDIMSYHNITIT